MKKIITICAAILMSASLWAQSPEKMSYQAVVRDGSNNLVASTAVGMQISILQGSSSGTAVYVETQTPTSNANGLVSLEIGDGTAVSGDFTIIDWANGPYFIKTETDPTGGASYSITGTSQLLSVPYALHAKTAESVTGTITETDPIFGASVAIGITGTDTTYWNNKLDSYTETDPIFGTSVASGITGTDTTYWNNKLDSYTETDPIFGASVAGGITGTDTTYWNNKLDSYTETDPIFGASVASGITGSDTTYWNTDNDATNELQNISINNDSLSLSNANTVSLKPYKQELSVSLSGDTLFLSNGNWVIIPGISAANAPTPTYPAGTVHCLATPTAIVEVTNSSTGKIWMDRNLGATQVATTSTDANSYGDLYQWGRRADGHQCRTSPTTTALSSVDQPANGNFILPSNSPFDWRSPQNTNLWQGVNGVNNPCPSGYRLPTETEWEAERTSWGSNNSNSAGAFASPLKLPVAGRRNSDGWLDHVGAYGHYWSSTVSSTNSRFLTFGSNNAFMVNSFRTLGFPVRCLKD